jgi:hypothetical protein
MLGLSWLWCSQQLRGDGPLQLLLSGNSIKALPDDIVYLTCGISSRIAALASVMSALTPRPSATSRRCHSVATSSITCPLRLAKCE